jgi:hypothetical protein
MIKIYCYGVFAKGTQTLTDNFIITKGNRKKEKELVDGFVAATL